MSIELKYYSIIGGSMLAEFSVVKYKSGNCQWQKIKQKFKSSVQKPFLDLKQQLVHNHFNLIVEIWIFDWYPAIHLYRHPLLNFFRLVLVNLA